MDGFLFNLKIDDLTSSSWICLLKLGLRPSFFLKCVFLDGFLLNLKVKDLITSSWICLLKLGLRPSVFLMNLLGWVSV